MVAIYDVLKASKGIHVDDTFAELWGRKLSNAYTVATYTGTLPATLQTVEGYLESYKIYGNTVQDGTPTPENPIVPSGCGERTENLFDVEDNMLEASNWEYNPDTYYTKYFINYKLSERQVQILKQRPCTCSVFENFSEGYIPGLLVFAICPTLMSSVSENNRILTNNGVKYARTFDFSSWDDIYLIIGYGNGFPDAATKQLKIDELFTNWLISIVPGSTAPSSYIPYGYKLPLTVNSVEYPIYLGDAQLAKDEYVDSETGKIYHNVGGELTPIDPPAPLPQIPTAAGTTAISWAGEGLAPSEVELTYRKPKGQ